jgi:hypothetical protein
MTPRAVWIRAERAAHSRALGAAQAFPLTGDGLYALDACQHAADATALAEARYRDWVVDQMAQDAAE